MDEYKRPYLHLFNAVTDAMEQLQAHRPDLALLTLEQAQREAERLFIEQE